MRRFSELLVLIGSLILAIKWALDPTGVYEPYIVVIGLVYGIGDFIFSKKSETVLKTTLENTSEIIQPVKIHSTKEPETFADLYKWESASVFFYERFNAAFPGLRSTTWFLGNEAISRLSIFLKAPLRFKTSNGFTTPIWWFGLGNNAIDRFKQIDTQTVLINYDEYKIARMAAVYSSSYRKLWIYVECDPMTPIGIYPNSKKNLTQALKSGETYTEEYAIYAGKHIITRAEYDDGSAVVGGKIINVSGDCELRVRQLTPYNFVICPHDSPINNKRFDENLEKWLELILKDPGLFDAFALQVSQLPILKD
jgi:hypothetical protein